MMDRPGARRILCVGILCIDTTLVCPKYPVEDTDQRCLFKKNQIGGNAANNCTVLSQLDACCEFLGTMTSNCQYTTFVYDHLNENNISYTHCPHYNDCKYPNSVIILNNQNGSRTILHHRSDWPEITLEDLMSIDLSQYSWIHFEGRRGNIQQIKKMINYIEEWNRQRSPQLKPIRISTELEKPHEVVSELLSCTDVIFIGKDFAKFKGCENMEQALEILLPQTRPTATVIVPWGEEGAVAYSKTSGVVRSPSFPPDDVIDTLGAGDTFCASVIHALHSGKDLLSSIVYGCKIAGAKVGMYGYEGLREFNRALNEKAQ